MVFPQFNAPILYKKPYVVTIHDLILHFFPGKKKTDFLSRMAYKFVIHHVTKNALHCFSVSKNTKNDMVKYLNIPENKITVTYNGVSNTYKPVTDAKELTKFKKEYSLPSQYILYTGVQRSHKNILRLIKAYDMFRKKGNKNVHLVLAGPIDAVYSEIPNLIQELHLEKYIHRLGLFPQAGMAKLYSAARVFIFPSLYEGFGIPPIEAMQCDTAVVASNTSSIPEVCSEAAMYFDPNNIEQMAEVLEEAVINTQLREKLIKNGREQCKKFSWDIMVKKMYEEYLRVL